MNRQSLLYSALVLSLLLCGSSVKSAPDAQYGCSKPPLEVTFAVAGDHYSGEVNCGNLFLQTDIPDAPLVRFSKAIPGRLYTLTMIDYDGNANGSWPDSVAPGKNSPVRHWIVGNIPGSILRSQGYKESTVDSASKQISVLQSYRAPHIPVVSDRYGVYLFEQKKPISFAPVKGPITNFDYIGFLRKYGFEKPVASNYFVAIYTSVSPFSGKPFHGNDVSNTWHQDRDASQKLAP